MIISYSVGASMYLNITNKCSNNCIYCIRNFDRSLWLEREPSREEIWEDIVGRNAFFDEVVYCGFGEPMSRLDDVILPLSPKIREKFARPIRINTNGQAGLLFLNRDISKELVDAGIDRISISLVAENAWLYNVLCRPKSINAINDASVHREVIEFIKSCQKHDGLEVEVTALDFSGLKLPEGIPRPDMQKCREIADRLDVTFRARKYYGPPLHATLFSRTSNQT